MESMIVSFLAAHHSVAEGLLIGFATGHVDLFVTLLFKIPGVAKFAGQHQAIIDAVADAADKSIKENTAKAATANALAQAAAPPPTQGQAPSNP